MFEKDAEEKGVEYANKQKRTTSINEDCGYSWGQVEEGYENGFKDGAEFGYNKGKNEAKEIIKALMKSVPYGAGKMATEAYDKAEAFLKEVKNDSSCKDKKNR